MQAGVRQSALAKQVEISAAYLNLIEHNRRRIGGKLLNDLARALGVEPAALTEGAELALLEGLRAAGARRPASAAAIEAPEDLASRFPGWAALVESQYQRIQALERMVEGLTDRLTHDPYLSASIHEVLSVVTAIRATAGILAEPRQIDPEWQARFHRNLYEDSQRLAESSQTLVAYLDAAHEDDGDNGLLLPHEELEQWLERRAFQVTEMEGDLPEDPETILNGPNGMRGSPAGRSVAQDYLIRYRQDAQRMPLAELGKVLRQCRMDPGAIARNFKCDAACVLRRLATLPEELTGGPVGLVRCDSSGTLTFRKPVAGFPLPRFGASCPIWPLFQALSRPTAPVRHRVEQSSRDRPGFDTYAIAQPLSTSGFDQVQVFEAVMLMVPAARDSDAQTLKVGTSCRICPRTDCASRREPSILTDGF